MTLQFDNVNATYNQLKNNGIEFINEPQDKTGWGMRAAHFSNPEGNLIEIWSELATEKWDKDLLADANEFNHDK